MSGAAPRLKHSRRDPGESVTNALLIISDYAEGDHPGPMHVEIPENEPQSSRTLNELSRRLFGS